MDNKNKKFKGLKRSIGPGDQFNLNPFGSGKIIKKIHSGIHFDVFKAELNGNVVCLKSPAYGNSEDKFFFSRYYGIDTSIFIGDTEEITLLPKELIQDSVFGFEILNRFLLNEYQIINKMGKAWNHQPIGIGTWDGLSNCHDKKRHDILSIARNTISPSDVFHFRFDPVIVMPCYDAIPFSDLQRIQKRENFPLMLPSLWTALCQGVHGDLSESNILVDRNFKKFHLIDPGNLIGSYVRQHLYSNGLYLFLTTPENYPLFPPFYDVPDIKLEKDKNLLFSLVSNFSNKYTGQVGSMFENIGRRTFNNMPAISDLFALGLIYYHIVTGDHIQNYFGELAERDIKDQQNLLCSSWLGAFGEYEKLGVWFNYSVYGEKIVETIEFHIQHINASIPEKRLLSSILLLKVKSREEIEELVNEVVAIYK
jgi:hypothetical protein